jgi:hypothetical protein
LKDTIDEVYQKVMNRECEPEELTRFSAKVLQDFAKSKSIHSGKTNNTKENIIKHLIQPARYPLPTAPGSQHITIHERAMEHIRNQGHTNVSYKRPKIYYTCKYCNTERTTEPQKITENWSKCMDCSRYGRTTNHVHEISETHERAMEHIRNQGHTNVSYQKPKIVYTCKYCNTQRTTESKNITETWSKCMNCSRYGRANKGRQMTSEEAKAAVTARWNKANNS